MCEFCNEDGYDLDGWVFGGVGDAVASKSAGYSDNSSRKDSSMVGSQFSTGNSTVRSLPYGAILRVVGYGQVEIVDVPKVKLTVEDFSEGDRVVTSHGPATVVRLSVRFRGLEGFDPSTQILYVADEDSVVRRQNASEVEFEL